MNNIDIFSEYENAKAVDVEQFRKMHPGSTYLYSELGEHEINGIPVCTTRNAQGELEVTFVNDMHLLGIGATRSGKTTGFVLPAINVMMKKKNKPDLVISDPKQELYSATAARFEEEGYKVILLDFINYMHSDCWNPLLKIYRRYHEAIHLEDNVISLGDGVYVYNNNFFADEQALKEVISIERENIMSEVENELLSVAHMAVPVSKADDPYWDNTARDVFRAILIGMLEDSESGKIDENTFSFDTLIRIFDTFSASYSTYDNGYFRLRPRTSKAYQLAKNSLLELADKTRSCVASTLATVMSKFRETAVRKVMCANSFEFSDLAGDQPTVIFLSYKDEETMHYEVISLFLSNLYTKLISMARESGGALARPFYFLLDEFGNLPPFADFDKVISACGSRNIWFLLILQSYAQLNNVYSPQIAEIIKDNLNMHIFFGTNNPQTKREFSEECGSKTILSPISALNGTGEMVEHYISDRVPLIPVSSLSELPVGECIITQMREPVLLAHTERSYLCPEFSGKKSDPRDRVPPLDFYNKKFIYSPQ